MSWKPLEYTGWGRTHVASGDVSRPERQSILSRILAATPAPAFGQRRSYGDVALNDGGKAIDMTRLDRVISFDQETGIVEAEAGLCIGDLGRSFAGKGWLPSVMPGTGFATVGGCIANDVHGKNHHVAGSFGQYVLEITLAQDIDGKITTRKITPLSEPDLFKATVGGLGQTGVIISAKLQMTPCKGDVMVLTERRIDSLDEFLTAFDESASDYTVGWIDATATGEHLGRGVLEEGEITFGINRSTGKTRSVPFNAPTWALSAPIVRLFNEMYFRRVPTTGRTTVKPITEPFFPLDAIHDWNRLYGKKGFHQFQCVIPLGQTDVLREMLAQVAASGYASPLAVLKKMGTGRAGFLSFPMEGYTLAVDFPNKRGAQYMIKSLTDMARHAGGRIYFAKDSVADAPQIDGMYPDLALWQEEVSKSDPQAALTTDLVRRLDLRSRSTDSAAEIADPASQDSPTSDAAPSGESS